jgi:hypothetical protein
MLSLTSTCPLLCDSGTPKVVKPERNVGNEVRSNIQKFLAAYTSFPDHYLT